MNGVNDIDLRGKMEHLRSRFGRLKPGLVGTLYGKIFDASMKRDGFLVDGMARRMVNIIKYMNFRYLIS
ncbi:MAG: hypothetical protein DRH17_08135 [Deltaproteobacteria bacterium]|nr:MAG: hypothetical protein DRH17_08135 [Deltaproteobacteria bacterium]